MKLWAYLALAAGLMIAGGLVDYNWLSGAHYREQIAETKLEQANKVNNQLLDEKARADAAEADLLTAKEANHELTAKLLAGPTIIRVCKRPVSGPTTAAASPSPDAAAPGAGVLPQENGGDTVSLFDIKPLFTIAEECEDVSSRLRDLQLYIKGK